MDGGTRPEELIVLDTVEDGGVTVDDIAGDGFDDSIPGEYSYDYSYAYSYADYGGDYSYSGDGDGEYAGDGSYDYSGYYYAEGGADIDGDGFEDGGEGSYDYDYAGYYADYSEGDGEIVGDGEFSGNYDISSAGDMNGDGFEDFLVEGNGYSYVVYGAEITEIKVGHHPIDLNDDVIYYLSTTGVGQGTGVYTFRDNTAAEGEGEGSEEGEGGGEGEGELPPVSVLDGAGGEIIIWMPGEDGPVTVGVAGPVDEELMYYTTQGDNEHSVRAYEWKPEDTEINFGIHNKIALASTRIDPTSDVSFVLDA